MDVNMTLAEKLKEARKNMGMTQAGLAQSLCVSRQAITKWEAGDWDIIVTSLRKPYKYGVSEVSPNIFF